MPGLSDVDHDSFGEAVLRAHPVGIPEELEESDTALKDCGAIAKSSLDGLPEAHALAGERDYAGAGDPFAGRLAVAEIVGQSPVENHRNDVSCFMKIPDDADFCLMEDEFAPGEFKGKPEGDGDHEVNEVAKDTLAECGKQQSIETDYMRTLVRAKPASCTFQLLGHGREFTSIDRCYSRMIFTKMPSGRSPSSR